VVSSDELNPGDDEGSSSQQRGLSGTNVAAAYCHDISRGAAMPATSEQRNVNIEPSDPSQPGMAERAIDTATDVSRTLTEVSGALQTAVGRLSDAITAARKPGMPLATVSAITREAPLASLFVAFLFGVAIARRR
jgi:hypothetical protein